MSSMIKKKGSLAFKPKAPIPRSRPTASTSSTRPSEPVTQRLPESGTATPNTETPNTASRYDLIASQEHSSEAPPPSSLGQVSPSVQQTRVEQSLPDVASKAPGRAAPSESTELHPCQTVLEQVADDAFATQASSRKNDAAYSEVDPSLRPTTTGDASVQPRLLELVQTVTPEPILNLSTDATTCDQRQEAASSSTTEAYNPPQTQIPPTQIPFFSTAAEATGTTAAEATSTITAEVASMSTKRRTKQSKTCRATQGAGATEAESRGPDKHRRQRKPKNNVEDAAPRPRARKRKPSHAVEGGSAPNRAKKRVRSPTPEDAESQTVDLQQLTMADLTKDLRIGKKFSRHDELRDRERQLRIQAKLGKDGGAQSQSGDGSPVSPRANSQAKSNSSTPASSAPPASAPAATSGPQFRIVDGQIVVDQSSLIMDRHALAAATQQDLETIEENDFTRLTTSSSYRTTSKLKGPNVWTVDETELFYRGLSMFGTEFEMISKMFPGKQRRHIKLKFNREERHNPKRIDAALVGEKTTKMDIEEYSAFTGAEFESVETIEAQQRKIQEDFEAQQQRKADEQAEEMRKRREELFADDDAKKKKGRKKLRQAVSYGLNGEPIAQPS